jgi:phosphatidylglycerophosphate synthase
MEQYAQNEPSSKIITVANTITAIGGGLAFDGLRRGIDTPLGLAEIITARFVDLVDGATARHLPHTKLGEWLGSIIGEDRVGQSTVGAKIDPALDRFEHGGILFELARKRAAPPIVIAGITTLEAYKAGASIIDYAVHPETRELRRPTPEGKLGSAATVLTMGAYAIEHILPTQYARTKSSLRTIGATAFGASMALGLQAAHSYTRRARGKE